MRLLVASLEPGRPCNSRPWSSSPTRSISVAKGLRPNRHLEWKHFDEQTSGVLEPVRRAVVSRSEDGEVALTSVRAGSENKTVAKTLYWLVPEMRLEVADSVNSSSRLDRCPPRVMVWRSVLVDPPAGGATP